MLNKEISTSKISARSELLTRILNEELAQSTASPELTEKFKEEMEYKIRYGIGPIFTNDEDIETEWREQIWERFNRFDTFGRI